jgi:lipase chaperone LimK
MNSGAVRVAFFGVAAIALMAFWLRTHGNAPTKPAATETPAQTSAATAQAPAASVASGTRTASATATETDPLLTADLRHTLELMLLEASIPGNDDLQNPAAFKQRLLARVPHHFPPGQVARATALITRYVDYRVALGGLKPPANPNDPEALRTALQARLQLRERHFTPTEYDALFAKDEALDRYTQAQLEIQRQAGLTPAQRQAAQQEAERIFTPQERAERAESQRHLAVGAQTAAMDAQGTSERDRYTQRATAYGPDTALRLGQLDSQERDWQARLSEYAAARDAKVSDSALLQLSERLFNEQERLRVDAALAARAAPK